MDWLSDSIKSNAVGSAIGGIIVVIVVGLFNMVRAAMRQPLDEWPIDKPPEPSRLDNFCFETQKMFAFVGMLGLCMFLMTLIHTLWLPSPIGWALVFAVLALSTFANNMVTHRRDPRSDWYPAWVRWTIGSAWIAMWMGVLVQAYRST